MGQFESPGESNSAYQRFRKHESEKTPKSNKTKGNKFSSYLQLAKKQVESRTKKNYIKPKEKIGFLTVMIF